MVFSLAVFHKAFLKWRELTAFLIQPIRTSRDAPKPSKEQLQAAISLNVEHNHQILQHFIKSDPEVQLHQKEHLGAIAFKVAELGLILFSQPSKWFFEWTAGGHEVAEKSERHGRPVLVLFPALNEEMDRGGREQVRLVVVVDWVAVAP